MRNFSLFVVAVTTVLLLIVFLETTTTTASSSNVKRAAQNHINFNAAAAIEEEEEEDDDAFVVSDDLIKKINQNPNVNWKAGKTKFYNMPMREFVLKQLGIPNMDEYHNNVLPRIYQQAQMHHERFFHHVKKSSSSSSSSNVATKESIRKAMIESNITLPDFFDSRQQWPNCSTIGYIRDQGDCGSCWSFGSSEALSDRFCIYSSGAPRYNDLLLSPEEMVECDKTSLGCDGGDPALVWHFLRTHGTTTDECVPYVSGDGHVPPCKDNATCTDGITPKQFYKVSNYYHVGSTIDASKHVVQIMQEIYEHGPVDATFLVYKDFMAYKSGVYRHVSGSITAAHSVKCIGWGEEENGELYWLVNNSWGDSWGINGTFKILRGVDECFFEAQIYAGDPLLLS